MTNRMDQAMTLAREIARLRGAGRVTEADEAQRTLDSLPGIAYRDGAGRWVYPQPVADAMDLPWDSQHRA